MVFSEENVLHVICCHQMEKKNVNRFQTSNQMLSYKLILKNRLLFRCQSNAHKKYTSPNAKRYKRIYKRYHVGFTIELSFRIDFWFCLVWLLLWLHFFFCTLVVHFHSLLQLIDWSTKDCNKINLSRLSSASDSCYFVASCEYVAMEYIITMLCLTNFVWLFFLLLHSVCLWLLKSWFNFN